MSRCSTQLNDAAEQRRFVPEPWLHVYDAVRPAVTVLVIPFAALRDAWSGSNLLATSYLSASECQHALSIRATQVADNYRLTRSFLRCILSNHTGCVPNDVNLSYLSDGKPVLYNGPVFNISHSRDLLVIAIAKSGTIEEIGVDVEPWVNDAVYPPLAERIFSSKEKQQLLSFSEGCARRVAFTRGWTRKEAVVKAIGCGIRVPLDKFDVSLFAAKANVPYQSMLLSSDLKQLGMQHCKLFDLSARLGSGWESELSLAVLGSADQYSIQLSHLNKVAIESVLSGVAI